MQVTILHQPKELLIQTVSLVQNSDEPNNLYLFRCPYCASSTGVQVQGKVAKISPGLDPTADVVTIYQCKGCKKLYTFQTLEYMNKKSTKVTLITVPGVIGVFSCWLCRNPLLQFRDDRIVKLPKFELVQVPFTMKCVNPQCIANYQVVDII